MSTSANDTAAMIEAAEKLFVQIRQTQQVNYIAVSALAFLAYDIIIKLSKEVELLWKDKFSIPKGLYFFARYYGILYLIVVTAVTNTPADLLSVNFCRHYLRFYSLAGDILFTSAVNVILMMRLAALYKYDRRVISFLVVLFFAEFGVELFVSIEITLYTWKSAFVAPPGIPIPGCLAVNPPMKFTLLAWIPCLTLSAILFFMTVVRVVKSSLAISGKITASSTFGFFLQSENVSPLLRALLRDGALHFFCITAILTVCTITTIAIKGPYAAIGLEWLIAVYSVSGSRLILNLRDAAHGDRETQTEAGLVLQTFRVCSGSTGTETYSSNLSI